MDPLSIYFLALAVALVLFVFVTATFLRYRFKGDKTYLIFSLFGILFVISVITTLSLALS